MELHHIERISNTRTNLQTNLDNLQIAIETDNDKNLVYKDGSGVYHIVSNTDGTDSRWSKTGTVVHLATSSDNLSLGSADDVSKLYVIDSTNPQVRIANDISNYLNLYVTPTGNASISLTGSEINIDGSLSLENGVAVNEFSTDGTFASESNSKIPTELAIKTYIDSTVGDESGWHKESNIVKLSDATDYVSVGTVNSYGKLTIINPSESYPILAYGYDGAHLWKHYLTNMGALIIDGNDTHQHFQLKAGASITIGNLGMAGGDIAIESAEDIINKSVYGNFYFNRPGVATVTLNIDAAGHFNIDSTNINIGATNDIGKVAIIVATSSYPQMVVGYSESAYWKHSVPLGGKYTISSMDLHQFEINAGDDITLTNYTAPGGDIYLKAADKIISQSANGDSLDIYSSNAVGAGNLRLIRSGVATITHAINSSGNYDITSKNIFGIATGTGESEGFRINSTQLVKSIVTAGDATLGGELSTTLATGQTVGLYVRANAYGPFVIPIHNLMTDDKYQIGQTPKDKAITITEVKCAIQNGTSFTCNIRHDTSIRGTGNQLVTSGFSVVGTTTGTVVTIFNDATVPANSYLWFDATSVVDSGSLRGSMRITYTVD